MMSEAIGYVLHVFNSVKFGVKEQSFIILSYMSTLAAIEIEWQMVYHFRSYANCITCTVERSSMQTIEKDKLYLKRKKENFYWYISRKKATNIERKYT